MSTFEKFRDGLQSVWENFAEGWQQLRESAGSALTRFIPVVHKDNLQTAHDIAVISAARWSLLTAEVEEGPDSISVRLEIPGMNAEDFDIAVLNDQLMIRGEKHASREHRTGQYHVMECAYGRFERLIHLPASVDDTGIQARYQRGVLMLSLPKKHRYQRRRIEVQHT